MLGYELLSAYPNIFHFVTTRQGGVSEGTYASFNCSPYCGDDQQKVWSNQERLMESFPTTFRQLIIPYQVHGTKIGLIDQAFRDLSAEEQKKQLHGVDAVVTNQSGCCVCVSTADCVPLLVYDRKQQVVAAIHAGWRGTVENITLSVLQKMRLVYGSSGEDLIVTIGPSISLSCFEVGEEVYETFREKGFDVSRISSFHKQTGKHHIDLWEANRIQLLEFGVPEKQIEISGICTYTHHDEFFSARRLGINSGRILSGIMLR